MIELVRQSLPYLLILFFIIKAIKEPLYLLGIIFLIFMSDSIFFNNVKIFQTPGRLILILPFIWLIIFWILSLVINFYKKSTNVNNTGRINEMDICILGLVITSFLGLVITYIKYSVLTGVFQEFINLMSLYVSYFIIKSWSSRNKSETLKNFLFSLVVINTIASVLYILHQGFHVKIYSIMEYLQAFIHGTEITRSFWFMPQFLTFSVAFLLVFNKNKNFLSVVILIINLLAIIITYTRSAVVITAFIFLLYFILVGLKKRSLQIIFRNVLIFGVVGILGFIIVSKFMPGNTQFLINRFSEINQSNFRESNNLKVRFDMSEIIISSIDREHKILGMGSVTERQLPIVTRMKNTTADMVWTGVIFRWGFIGLALFFLLYIISTIKAFKLYMTTQGVLSELALLFILILFSQLIESFVSWTFLSGHGYSIGLWYFAMLSALLTFSPDEIPDNVKVADEGK